MIRWTLCILGFTLALAALIFTLALWALGVNFDRSNQNVS